MHRWAQRGCCRQSHRPRPDLELRGSTRSGVRGRTHEAVSPADRGRVAGDAAVGGWGYRGKGGHRREHAVHFSSMQLVALCARRGQAESAGHCAHASPRPPARPQAYHALVLVQTAKPRAHGAAWWEGQRRRATPQHGPKARLAWRAPELGRGVQAAVCGEGLVSWASRGTPGPTPGVPGEPHTCHVEGGGVGAAGGLGGRVGGRVPAEIVT